MRDINRIKPTLKKIEDLWFSNPDLRFGQLVINIFRTDQQNPKIFYIEDDVFLEKLNEFQDFLDNKNDFK